MIPDRSQIFDWIQSGKLKVAYNGSVIVEMTRDEFVGYKIEDIILGFQIYYPKYLEFKQICQDVDVQTRLTFQRPGHNSQHWWNAKVDKEFHSGED